jgi:hypothetical protein
MQGREKAPLCGRVFIVAAAALVALLALGLASPAVAKKKRRSTSYRR